MRKRLIIYLIILCCIIVALVSVIYFSKVSKYKMSEIEIEQYRNCLAEYEEITSNISDIGIEFLHQYDEKIDKRSFLYNHICNLKSEYMKLLEIEFPNKYKELYTQLIYTECVRDIAQDLAYATISPDESIGEYFPPNELLDYMLKLEDQLQNPNYVPSDVSRPDFAQIYYKIEQEYLKENKSASEIYEELHEILYNDGFIKDLK